MTQKELMNKGKEINERRVKELSAQGFTTGEIARELNIEEFIVVRILKKQSQGPVQGLQLFRNKYTFYNRNLYKGGITYDNYLLYYWNFYQYLQIHNIYVFIVNELQNNK